MTQEDINSMMMTPAESYAMRHKSSFNGIKCPKCGEKYLGDGIKPCVDCQALIAELDKEAAK